VRVRVRVRARARVRVRVRVRVGALEGAWLERRPDAVGGCADHLRLHRLQHLRRVRVSVTVS